jgi:hypothetical protein
MAIHNTKQKVVIVEPEDIQSATMKDAALELSSWKDVQINVAIINI